MMTPREAGAAIAAFVGGTVARRMATFWWVVVAIVAVVAVWVAAGERAEGAALRRALAAAEARITAADSVVRSKRARVVVVDRAVVRAETVVVVRRVATDRVVDSLVSVADSSCRPALLTAQATWRDERAAWAALTDTLKAAVAVRDTLVVSLEQEHAARMDAAAVEHAVAKSDARRWRWRALVWPVVAFAVGRAL